MPTISQLSNRLAMFARSHWYLFVIGALAIAVAISALGFLRFKAALETYCGIRLTYDRKEVLYRLGYPPVVLDEPEKTEFGYWQRVYYTDRKGDPKNVLPADKHIEDFREWSYSKGPVTETIRFNASGTAIESVSCMELQDDPQGLCPPIASVATGDTEEQLKHKLGEHHFRYRMDGVSKTIRYDDFGIEILLTKDKVYGLTLLRDRSDTKLVLLRYLQSALP